MQSSRSFLMLSAAITFGVSLVIVACRGDDDEPRPNAAPRPPPEADRDPAVPPARAEMTAGQCGPMTFAARYGGPLPASWIPDETARAFASDAEDALYVTGWSRNANFGSGASPVGDPALFVLKLDAARARAWDKTFGNQTPGLVGPHAAGMAIAAHPLGGVLVVGAFAGTLSFDGPVLRSAAASLDTGGACTTGDGFDCPTDAFFARFDAEGKTSFVGRLGGPGYDDATDVIIDEHGTAIVGGTFAEQADVGGTILTSAGGYDIFVLRLAASGAPIASFRLGGAQDEQLAGIGVMPDGDIVVAGTFTFQTTIGETRLTSLGLTDGFVARVSPSGEPRWVKGLAAAEGMDVRALKTDIHGNIYVGGGIGTSQRYDAPEGVAFEDAIVVALDAFGTERWRKTWGAGHRSSVSSLALDTQGALVVVGTTVSGAAIDFGGGRIGGGVHAWPFVVDLDSQGVHRCSRAYPDVLQAGAAPPIDSAGPTGASGYGVLAVGERSIVFGGAFSGTVNLGQGLVTSQGGSDVYFAEVSR